MGKGDPKTKKGKITLGTFGVRRPKKKSNPYTAAAPVKKATTTKPKAKPKAKPKVKTTKTKKETSAKETTD